MTANGCNKAVTKDISAIAEKPSRLNIKAGDTNKFKDVKKIVIEHKINTVCKEAKCPNCGKCWSSGTATIMILGSVCTRGCRFCAIATGNPKGALDLNEPDNCAEAVRLMGLKHVVITSVDRDDLIDGGAQHYATCVQEVKKKSPHVTMEVLTPDFQGDSRWLSVVLKSGIDIFAHNLETVRRLTPVARDKRASFDRSLGVLSYAKQTHPNIITKSSLMLGLGETESEVIEAMEELKDANVDVLTLGQYLQPTPRQLPVERHLSLDEFDYYRRCGFQKGFKEVLSGPLVRSSYLAEEIMGKIKNSNRL